jgi:hypothetical protein
VRGKHSKRSSTVDFKESKTTFDSFIVTLVYFSYLAIPAIIRVCLSTFRFERVCDTWYFAVDHTVVYTSDQHTLMMLVVALPGLILYAVLLMVFTLWYLWKSQDQLKSRRFTFRVGLLYSGYRKSTWWWECIVFLRKVMVIVVATFVELPYLQLMLSLGICVLLLVAQQHCMPMEAGKNGSNLLHVVEISSLLILLIILWCSLYFERDTNCQNGDAACEFLGAVIIFANVLFLLACVGLFFKSFAAHHNLKRKVRAVKSSLSKKFRKKIGGTTHDDGLEGRKTAAEKEVEMSQVELTIDAVVVEESYIGDDCADHAADADADADADGDWFDNDALPQGWDTATDEDGDVYYYNEETGVTQWDRPTEQEKSWSRNPMSGLRTEI